MKSLTKLISDVRSLNKLQLQKLVKNYSDNLDYLELLNSKGEINSSEFYYLLNYLVVLRDTYSYYLNYYKEDLFNDWL